MTETPVGERAPDALMPVWLARLAGFAGLGSLGALEWQRMVAGFSSAHALLWVAAALVAGGAVAACGRVAGGRRRALALAGASLGGAILAYAASGAPLRLLKPGHWDELFTTIGTGTRALGTVRMPYDAVAPAPRIAIEVLGAELLLLAAVLSLWPGTRARSRGGFPFIALAALLVLVASPVVSLGGTRPLVLGAVLAALCIGFLWLDRLPLRPGLGVAALVGVALAGALPLAAAADRGQPWFDYKSFAENLGPDDPVHFSWNQEYGPVDWPRDGNEVMRIQSPKPLYWKAEDLEDFDGVAWRARPPSQSTETTAGEVPEDWENRPAWTSQIKVEVRRMTSTDLITAGTTMSVQDTSRNIVRGQPGMYVVPGGLHRGDSYTATVHVPEPAPGSLTAAVTGTRGEQFDDLVLDIPFRKGRRLSFHALGHGGHGHVNSAVVHFRPFGVRGAFATFPQLNVSSFDVERIMRRTVYWRTYELAQRLRRRAQTPYDYILSVNRYLHRGFSYSERPEPVPRGRAPLDGFLFDTKEGYCQHFSGAMALLLRMGGIAARVATGFSPGGYSARYKAWIVRDTDAHAWVEAWFDNIGWVTFDPTPSETPARSQIFALQDVKSPASTATDTGAAGAAGNTTGARKPSNFLRPDLGLDRQTRISIGGPGARGRGGLPVALWVLIGLAAIGVGAWLVSVLRWRRDPRPPAERSVAELEAALRRAGRPQPPATTLAQLEKLFGGSSDAISYLRALSAARYGPVESPPTAAQRRRLRRALGDGLGFWGRLRAWWALPPRGR